MPRCVEESSDWIEGASIGAKEEEPKKPPPTRAPIGIDAMNSTAASMGAALRSAAMHQSATRRKAEAEAGDSSDSDWE